MMFWFFVFAIICGAFVMWLANRDKERYGNTIYNDPDWMNPNLGGMSDTTPDDEPRKDQTPR